MRRDSINESALTPAAVDPGRASAQVSQRPIVFLVNHAAFFVSHRLPIAQALLSEGVPVRLLTGQGASDTMEAAAQEELARSGVPHTRVSLRSSGVNPLRELWGLLQLICCLVKWRPLLVHCVSPKGVLYGGVAARVARVPALVLAVSGMGYAFTSSEERRVFRAFVQAASRVLARLAYGHPNKRVIVQNDDDRLGLLERGLATSCEIVLIRGSGAQLDRLVGMRIEEKQRVVLLPARMLRDKGVVEFVEAARRLKTRCREWRFVLAGAADYENPSAVTSDQLAQWQRDGSIEWLGFVPDMTEWFARASIVCLPSYREGMPKALLEAAAAGCAVVTTDVTGCRDAIIPNRTGTLVPARDAPALADALQALIEDCPRREAYGRAGRQLAVEQFGIDAVIARTLQVYDEVCIGH